MATHDDIKRELEQARAALQAEQVRINRLEATLANTPSEPAPDYVSDYVKRVNGSWEQAATDAYSSKGKA